MPKRSRIQVVLLLVAGLLCLQVAWVVSLAPFGGMDEVDHVFRVSSLSHGQIHTDLGPAANGRGELVLVSPDLVEAAHSTCENYAYTGTDNCVPTRTEGDLAVIASAASNYQPLYYLAVSWADRISEGFATVYLLRIVTVMICLLLLGLAAWRITARARDGWMLAGLAFVATPTAVYSSAVVSANGVEIAAATLLWVLLLEIASHRDPRDVPGALVVAVTLCAVLFVWLRPLAAVWLLFILLAWLTLVGARWFGRFVRARPMQRTAAMCVIGLSALGSVYWMISFSESGSLNPTAPDTDDRLSRVGIQPLLWIFQVIAAVPLRNVASPPIVYACGVGTLVFIVALGLRHSDRRTKGAVFVAVALSLGLALWYSWIRYPYAGTIWQGRYSWPVLSGVVLLLARACASSRSPRTRTTLAVIGSISVVVSHVVAVSAALLWEREHNALAEAERWNGPPIALVVVVALIGSALVVAAPWTAHRAVRQRADLVIND